MDNNTIDAAFPRGTAMPKQSALFWASQKDRFLRQQLISDIEKVTNRRLVVQFENRWEQASIESRDVVLLGEIMSDLNGDDVDLFLETNGGGTDATEALISLIQSGRLCLLRDVHRFLTRTTVPAQ